MTLMRSMRAAIMEGEAAYKKFVSQFFFDMFVKGSGAGGDVEGEAGDVSGKKRSIDEAAGAGAEADQGSKTAEAALPAWVVDALNAVGIDIVSLVRERELEEQQAAR